MAKISINEMTENDINTISPLLLSEFDNFWSIENLKSEVKNPNTQCFVAKIGNEIVGFGSIMKIIDVVHLNNIVVRKKYRNLGIGTTLLEHLINVSLLMDDVTSMTLEVNESNKIAQKLYEHFGFEIVGLRKNYYGQNENAIIMTKEFND